MVDADLPGKRTLRVVQPPPAAAPVDCLECAQCCTYVALDIDPPSRPAWAIAILRLLGHEGLSVRCGEDNDWFVQFETRCRHLRADRLCAIYPHRPHICRGYDNTTCEVNQPSDVRIYETRAAFLDYLERARPRIYKALADRGLTDAR